MNPLSFQSASPHAAQLHSDHHHLLRHIRLRHQSCCATVVPLALVGRSTRSLGRLHNSLRFAGVHYHIADHCYARRRSSLCKRWVISMCLVKNVSGEDETCLRISLYLLLIVIARPAIPALVSSVSAAVGVAALVSSLLVIVVVVAGTHDDCILMEMLAG